MGCHTGEQFRAARAMLGWDQAELAQRANVSVKTIKRLESFTGRVEAHSDYGVAKALERGGIEFVGEHDWRQRSDGVRFAKEPTGRLREELIEETAGWLTVTLKMKSDEDKEFFERSTDEILKVVLDDSREGLRLAIERALNRRN